MQVMNIKEMAKLAGVSCATISRVLNDSGYVKEDTRKKVMGIIKEYNYTPNMIARSLSSKDSFTIGMIIPGVGEKQYGKILEGAAKETAKHGYSLVFMDSENDLKTEKKWLEEVKNQHMKGLVLVPVRSENKELRSILQELEANGTAVVLTEKDVKNAGMDGVFADEFRGAYEGICRLIEKGCKRIGIAVGQMENDAATEERYRGCVQALEDNGIEVDIVDPSIISRSQYFDTNVEAKKFIGNLFDNKEYDAILFSATTGNWGVTKEMIQQIHEEFPNIPICVGGIHVSYFARYIITGMPYLIALKGEGEKNIVSVIQNVKNYNELKKIPNIVFYDGEQVVETVKNDAEDSATNKATEEMFEESDFVTPPQDVEETADAAQADTVQTSETDQAQNCEAQTDEDHIKGTEGASQYRYSYIKNHQKQDHVGGDRNSNHQETPQLEELKPEHFVACHRAKELMEDHPQE